jgi:hypothetical protein
MQIATYMIRMNRWIVVPAALLLLAVGCQSHKWETAEERDPFLPEDDTRSYARFATAHAAASARQDGTLRDYHFEGDDLNSLGQSRLELMLKDNSHAYPIVIYIDTDDAKLMKSRQMTVAAFLRDAGLLESQVKFEAGPNPNVTSPAAQNLARLSKSDESGATPAGPSGGAPAGGAADASK